MSDFNNNDVVVLPALYGRSRLRLIPESEPYSGFWETTPLEGSGVSGIWTEDELEEVVISSESQIPLEDIPSVLRDIVSRILAQGSQARLADLHDLEHVAHSVSVHSALGEV